MKTQQVELRFHSGTYTEEYSTELSEAEVVAKIKQEYEIEVDFYLHSNNAYISPDDMKIIFK